MNWPSLTIERFIANGRSNLLDLCSEATDHFVVPPREDGRVAEGFSPIAILHTPYSILHTRIT